MRSLKRSEQFKSPFIVSRDGPQLRRARFIQLLCAAKVNSQGLDEDSELTLHSGR